MISGRSDNAVESRVSSRLLRVKRFFVHLIVTLVVAVGLTAASARGWVANEAADALIPAAILIFVAHALWLAYQEATYMIVQQETGDDWDEKPKRDTRLAVGDDGELVEIDEPHAEKRKRE